VVLGVIDKSRDARQSCGDLRSVVSEMCEPDALFIFSTNVHRHDPDFITWGQLRQLFSNCLNHFGPLEKPAGAVVATIKDQDQSERFTRLALRG
jgi:hypothetical protein